MTRFETPKPLDDLNRRVQDTSHDTVVALGRFTEALELLHTWSREYPDSDLARMSTNLLNRCEETTP